MRSLRFAVPVALLTLLPVLPASAEAQTRVVIGVESGRPAPHTVYTRRPVRRRVVVAPRVVVVERIVVDRRGNDRGRGWWKRHGYQPVTLYRIDGRYYDRPFDSRHGVREVVVYSRGGRYYRAAHDRYRDRDRHDDRDGRGRWRNDRDRDRDDDDWDD